MKSCDLAQFLKFFFKFSHVGASEEPLTGAKESDMPWEVGSGPNYLWIEID